VVQATPSACLKYRVDGWFLAYGHEIYRECVIMTYLVTTLSSDEVNRVVLHAPNGRVNLSMSAGLCRCHPDGAGIDDIVRRADAALYEAKAAGRNAVMAHPGGQQGNVGPFLPAGGA
ncbi:GGDEF domain-containing protein, partial [Thiobacillus sp.]